MLTIFATTDLHSTIHEMILQEDRLEELIEIREGTAEEGFQFSIHEGKISLPIFWDNSLPPYLFPQSIAFSPENLLALIFHFLENDPKAWQYAEGGELAMAIENQNRLKYGFPIEKLPVGNESYENLHNLGVIHHYSTQKPEPVTANYSLAIEKAPNDDYAAFSLKELATYELDRGNLSQAEAYLEKGLEKSLSEQATFALKFLLGKVWMQMLQVPYDQELLSKVKGIIWEGVNFFEKSANKGQLGLLLLDATHIANISESYSEALGYISRAISIFEEEGYQELVGSAILRKGTLLYTWAQNGNPQFYKSAVEAYQKALQIFSKEVHPDVFADIHHNLAVLYAEIPSDPKRKSIWAGVSSASFQEALEFYTKQAYPYQYGSICNNYGNALIKFPKAVHSDNYEKAIQYYNEALSVRTADQFPYERAISLLNYLEASWSVGNDPDPEVFNYMRFEDMLEKAKEVKELVTDASMIEEANRHLQNLEELRSVSNYSGHA
ncbi:MAG: hypothetical protein R8P61_36780 [Bacteroidia bacterium]|nr:hypothetical protein [Bacteroidia bacterium]